MDWPPNINLSGVPWWAAFALMLLTFVATKGVDAILRVRKAKLEERQYEFGETKEGYQALIAELKEQVKELKGNVATVLAELREVRAAHINCEVGQAELRGEMNVMKEKLAALERHDRNNADHVKGVNAAIAKIDPSAAAELLPKT